MSKTAEHRDAVIEDVFKAVPPVTLASELSVTPQALYQWRRVPSWHVRRIAELSGIEPERLRPDLFPTPADAAE